MKQVLAGVLLGCVLANCASAAGDPKADITKVMPPARPHPSGTLLFAIFPREGNDWDEMTATAWEFAPDRAEQPLVRRCVFLKSHWSARPTSSNSPDLIRLQVNDGPRPYSVRLYHIDYATWKVRTLYSGRQVGGIGRAGNHAYLFTSEGPRVLDTRSGKLTETEVTRVLASTANGWLIELKRKEGPRGGPVRSEVRDGEARAEGLSAGRPGGPSRSHRATRRRRRMLLKPDWPAHRRVAVRPTKRHPAGNYALRPRAGNAAEPDRAAHRERWLGSGCHPLRPRSRVHARPAALHQRTRRSETRRFPLRKGRGVGRRRSQKPKRRSRASPTESGRRRPNPALSQTTCRSSPKNCPGRFTVDTTTWPSQPWCTTRSSMPTTRASPARSASSSPSFHRTATNSWPSKGQTSTTST